MTNSTLRNYFRAVPLFSLFKGRGAGDPGDLGLNKIILRDQVPTPKKRGVLRGPKDWFPG